jgi:HrpA-like RNA helicase
LQLKALGVVDILAFDFMDRPPQASIERALRVLYDLGCLDDTGARAGGGWRVNQSSYQK